MDRSLELNNLRIPEHGSDNNSNQSPKNEGSPRGEEPAKMKMTEYDKVKVYVILETSRYIYSRFLMSRILTLIKVDENDAVKITLEIKKTLVKGEIKEIT